MDVSIGGSFSFHESSAERKFEKRAPSANYSESISEVCVHAWFVRTIDACSHLESVGHRDGGFPVGAGGSICLRVCRICFSLRLPPQLSVRSLVFRETRVDLSLTSSDLRSTASPATSTVGK